MLSLFSDVVLCLGLVHILCKTLLLMICSWWRVLCVCCVVVSCNLQGSSYVHMETLPKDLLCCVCEGLTLRECCYVSFCSKTLLSMFDDNMWRRILSFLFWGLDHRLCSSSVDCFDGLKTMPPRDALRIIGGDGVIVRVRSLSQTKFAWVKGKPGRDEEELKCVRESAAICGTYHIGKQRVASSQSLYNISSVISRTLSLSQFLQKCYDHELQNLEDCLKFITKAGSAIMDGGDNIAVGLFDARKVKRGASVSMIL